MVVIYGREMNMNDREQKNFLIYSLPNENVEANVLISDDNIWVSQKEMAKLFGIDRTGVGKHLRNIFADGELDEKVVCANFAHTTNHGAIEDKVQSMNLKYYNLEAVISVGYRVNTTRAIKFRAWATSVLKEYIQKGFALDDERLKKGKKCLDKTILENY